MYTKNVDTGNALSSEPARSTILSETELSELTLEDIAKQAGVSRSTVSRVVNNHPYVKAEVRKKVLKVIQDEGYHPNAAARTLVSQRSSMIGLVIPRSVSSFFTDPYFPHLTQGILQACNQNNYTLALFVISTNEDEAKILPKISRNGFLDGLILQTGVLGDQLVDQLTASNMPLVVAGRPHQQTGISYVDVDNVAAATVATNHLLQLGRTRVAAITGPLSRSESIDRKNGYVRALTAKGIPIDEKLIAETDFSGAGGYAAMQQLLPWKPDAVFAASDDLAIGAIHAVRDAGLRVPEDIAFVGFDDLPTTALSGINLTTIRQPVALFGIKLVEVLLDLIENGTKPTRRMIMDTELIIRDTCGASLQK
jgi:LacI family transcriptional regulator